MLSHNQLFRVARRHKDTFVVQMIYLLQDQSNEEKGMVAGTPYITKNTLAVIRSMVPEHSFIDKPRS